MYGGSETESYSYDAQGNTTTENSAAAYGYNSFNRLSSASGATDYVGPEGQRLRKITSSGTMYFAPDAGGPLLAENSNGTWVDCVWLNGRLIGRIARSTVDAIHDDHTGRPQVVANASKTVVWKAANYPFERNVALGTIGGLNLGFPGQYYDAERWLWNNGFRDYNASLGRYVEFDPMGLNGGINGYAYVGGSPVGSIDPDGLLCFDFNQFADDIRDHRFNLDAVLGTLLADLGVGTMPKTLKELRGFGVPKEELNPITNQLSRWSGRLGTRSLRKIGRSVGGRLVGGAATGSLLIEGAYDLYVEGKAAVKATKSNGCDCKDGN